MFTEATHVNRLQAKTLYKDTTQYVLKILLKASRKVAM